MKRRLKRLAKRAGALAQTATAKLKSLLRSSILSNLLLITLLFRVELLHAKANAIIAAIDLFKTDLAGALISIYLSLATMSAETLERVKRMFELFNA